MGWNEIKQRAVQFSREWAEESREAAEAKSFWDAFFNVFGIPRRSVATFEEPVRKLSGQYGYIDLFWKGRLLVEIKVKSFTSISVFLALFPAIRCACSGMKLPLISKPPR